MSTPVVIRDHFCVLNQLYGQSVSWLCRGCVCVQEQVVPLPTKPGGCFDRSRRLGLMRIRPTPGCATRCSWPANQHHLVLASIHTGRASATCMQREVVYNKLHCRVWEGHRLSLVLTDHQLVAQAGMGWTL
jgi:hypothetical protein